MTRGRLLQRLVGRRTFQLLAGCVESVRMLTQTGLADLPFPKSWEEEAYGD